MTAGLPTEAYVAEKVAQIEMAVNEFGGNGVTAIIERVTADGFPDVADELAAQLVTLWSKKGAH